MALIVVGLLKFVFGDFVARCSDGQLRLTDGQIESIGRVEICTDKRWETFYYSRWSSMNTHVACLELGFSSTYI